MIGRGAEAQKSLAMKGSSEVPPASMFTLDAREKPAREIAFPMREGSRSSGSLEPSVAHAGVAELASGQSAATGQRAVTTV